MMIDAASRPFEMRLIGPEDYEALEAEWAIEISDRTGRNDKAGGLAMVKAAGRPLTRWLSGRASKAAEAGGAAPSPSSMSREGAVGQRFSCSDLGAELSEVGGLVDSAPGLDLTEDSMVEPSNAAERI